MMTHEHEINHMFVMVTDYVIANEVAEFSGSVWGVYCVLNMGKVKRDYELK